MTPAPAIAPTSPAPAPAVAFAAAPTPDASRWVVGRTPAEARTLLPRVFNLCAAAHRAACTHALGLMADDATTEDAAMQAETVRDHGVALFHTWPALLGAEPDRESLKALTQPDSAWTRRIAVDDLTAFSPADLDAWLAAGATGPARTLRAIRDRLDPAWGRAALPALASADLDAALAAPGWRPARDATVLERVRRAPLIAGLLAQEEPQGGPTLFTRLLARVVDLLWAASGRARAPLSGRTPGGAGFAQAARGLLVHRAQVIGERITAYAVLAPSAWTLAPDGVLARMLAALPSRRETPMLAQLAACAVNPCVPVSFSFGAEA